MFLPGVAFAHAVAFILIVVNACTVYNIRTYNNTNKTCDVEYMCTQLCEFNVFSHLYVHPRIAWELHHNKANTIWFVQCSEFRSIPYSLTAGGIIHCSLEWCIHTKWIHVFYFTRHSKRRSSRILRSFTMMSNVLVWNWRTFEHNKSLHRSVSNTGNHHCFVCFVRYYHNDFIKFSTLCMSKSNWMHLMWWNWFC